MRRVLERKENGREESEGVVEQGVAGCGRWLFEFFNWDSRIRVLFHFNPLDSGLTLQLPNDFFLNELEGLARGADSRDCPPASRATLDPEHVARVAESAKAALSFARSRNPAIRCLTTRGTVLTSSTFTVEEDVDKDGLTRNDDRILATCLSLCKAGNKDQVNAEEGQPRRLRREVVLLTEDRNLRVKALARDVPVREVPDFMQWAGLG
ncbi:Telomerase-binding protein EST1A [Eufriesea mexicana]|nr:Telomerase-binding protein EST1A [Eufriesea mexicana]